jgi:hypothetical protein
LEIGENFFIILVVVLGDKVLNQNLDIYLLLFPLEVITVFRELIAKSVELGIRSVAQITRNVVHARKSGN